MMGDRSSRTGTQAVLLGELGSTLVPDARVLFMAGFLLEDSIREAIDAGVYLVAYKPFDIEKVFALVKQIVAKEVY